MYNPFRNIIDKIKSIKRKKVKLLISHTYENNKQTLGQLLAIKDGSAVFSCATLELPYLNNTRTISRINTGLYKCVKKAATKAIPYEHIWIKNVDGRVGICIHIGNFASGVKVDILGCVIVGNSHKDINSDGELDVISSRKTFNKLMSILPEEFDLEIK